jgi:hypothetical protein
LNRAYAGSVLGNEVVRETNAGAATARQNRNRWSSRLPDAVENENLQTDEEEDDKQIGLGGLAGSQAQRNSRKLDTEPHRCRIKSVLIKVGSPYSTLCEGISATCSELDRVPASISLAANWSLPWQLRRSAYAPAPGRGQGRLSSPHPVWCSGQPPFTGKDHRTSLPAQSGPVLLGHVRTAWTCRLRFPVRAAKGRLAS